MGWIECNAKWNQTTIDSLKKRITKWRKIKVLEFWEMPGPTMNRQRSVLYIIVDHNVRTHGTLTRAVVVHRPAIADTWYSLSYLYYSAVGCLGCIAAGIIISFLTGWLYRCLSLGPRKTWASLMHWRTRWMASWCDFGSTARSPSSQTYIYSLQADTQNHPPEDHIHIIINI